MYKHNYNIHHFLLGHFWIDPNGGCTTDAVQVYCNFTDGVPKTCIAPQQSEAERKNWNGESIWFSGRSGGFQVDNMH